MYIESFMNLNILYFIHHNTSHASQYITSHLITNTRLQAHEVGHSITVLHHSVVSILKSSFLCDMSLLQLSVLSLLGFHRSTCSKLFQSYFTEGLFLFDETNESEDVGVVGDKFVDLGVPPFYVVCRAGTGTFELVPDV